MKLPRLPQPPDLLGMIRSVSEDVQGPEDEPRRPPGFLSDRDARDIRRADPTDKRLEATNDWHNWADDVRQRNRKAYASVLWACNELRGYRDAPEFGQYGVPLTRALIRFGNQDNVPTDPIERRRLVEAWTAKGNE